MSGRNNLIVQEDQDFQLIAKFFKQGGFNEWKVLGSFILFGFFVVFFFKEYKQGEPTKQSNRSIALTFRNQKNKTKTKVKLTRDRKINKEVLQSC